MLKILGYAFGVLLIFVLSLFSILSCFASVEIKKYEDLDKGDPKEGGSNE